MANRIELFETVLERLIDRYFEQAMKEVGSKEVYNDDAVIQAIANYNLNNAMRDDAIAALARWIRSYKIARPKWKHDDIPKDQDTPLAETVAGIALDMFGNHKADDFSVCEGFRELRCAVGQAYFDRMGKEQRFTSLTAKVLWCFKYDEAPIYDDYAYRATTALIKLYKAVSCDEDYDTPKDIVNYDPKKDPQWDQLPKADIDFWWFKEFHNSYKVLFSLSENIIVKKMPDDTSRPDHVNSLRIFDKVLWLYGNSELDFNAEYQKDRAYKS